MANLFPITLIGDNLGKRHSYLNTLVNEAFERNEDFSIIKDLPEWSPIDRIFKIDYASKIRNVDYIIKNLKDDDMLYVSKALKSKWLLETKYDNIIQPEYLEESLYPRMITTAITKMKHWIYINLKDENKALLFYEYYYKKKDYGFAVKFLTKCSKDVIAYEFKNVIHHINPHYFKILIASCPLVIKVFYDALPNDEDHKRQYLSQEKRYFLAIRHALKTDTSMILDINEKYFNVNNMCRFSASQTKFIMKYYSERFWKKPELYATWLLNIQAVAECFDSEEAKTVVLILARAKYLRNWFSYKYLEPLIKRLKPEERAEFKKKVFVTKDIGENVEEWPYATPAPPIQEISEYATIFDDPQHNPREYQNMEKRKIMKKKGYGNTEIFCCASDDCGKVKTLLDKLFDVFRFKSFGQTLYDLRKRIAAESSPQNREFMILVLVSKSGGRVENIALLLDLLAKHNNEPPNVRAAIIRSLVKRAYIWRLPDSSWNKLLIFGKNLGLDGNMSEAECYEGLHAVVIRSLLLTGTCQSVIFNAFLNQFSKLTNYSLNDTEKKIVKETLPNVLISVAKDKKEVADTASCLDKLIDSLITYNINIETFPGLIDIIVENSNKDISEMSCILNRLYWSKIARKRLFHYNFVLIRSIDSYMNAIKHDTTVIDAKKFADLYINKEITKSDTFCNKLSIYFSEENGLASKFLINIKENKYNQMILSRPSAILLRDQFHLFLMEIDTQEDKKSQLIAARIRANAHLNRPIVDIDSLVLKKCGAKLIANRVLKCRLVEVNKNIENLLKWKRTAKLAFKLSKRVNQVVEVFIRLANCRPTVVLKLGFQLMKLYGDETDPLIWETIKPIIEKMDVSKSDRLYLVRTIAAIDKVPLKIRPEYSTVIYCLLKNMNYFKAMPPLCHIEILLPDVNTQFIDNLLETFLKNDFVLENLSNEQRRKKCTCLYIRILIKYLLLCKSDCVQNQRLQKFAYPFFETMESIENSLEKKVMFPEYMNEVIKTLKYNKVFLNTEYVSPLPVIEAIVIQLKKFLTIDVHFQTFTMLHLSMIYFKAVRQALELVPEVFATEKKKCKDGVKIVGTLFGKYVAKDVNALVNRYFESVIEMYYRSFVKYLEKGNISSDWLSAIIKGILEQSKDCEYRMGFYLLSDKHRSLKHEDAQEIQRYLNELKYKEVEWFAYNYAYKIK